MTDIEITTLADRPDRMPLTADLHDPDVPEFLYQDAVSTALFVDLIAQHPDYTLLAVEPGTGRPAAMMCTMPFTMADGLPPGGYDAVLLAAAADTVAGRPGNAVSALFATVRADLRGQGLSTVLLDAALANTARLGHDRLFAPVRPTRKHEHPAVAMSEYVTWRRPDGTAADPWLRVHESAGGQLVAVAPHSMTITATLAQWRRWTGLPFENPGAVVVPGALTPVISDPDRDIATYIEPNVWYRHDVVGHAPAETGSGT